MSKKCVQKLKNGKYCSYDKKVGDLCTRHYNINNKNIKVDVKECITITFGDQAENNVGMQKIGKLSDSGFTNLDLQNAQSKFEDLGCKCENINLINYLPEENRNDVVEASILVVRGGVNYLLKEIGKNGDDIFKEQKSLKWDSKAKMYGRVVNKNARRNLCYANYEQKPDYENGKGRIVSYNNIPFTKFIKDKLESFIGEKAKELQGEGNYYYDISKTGIGSHGDAERKKVIAIRLGNSDVSMQLQYAWFLNSKHIGEKLRIDLNSSDLYIMSEKAVGQDWKKKKIPTLRHSAGCEKYLKL